MASITGIEVTPDSCALVGVRPAGRVTAVFALHVIEPGGSSGAALAQLLAGSRTTRRFPRRARAVIWGAPEGASPDDSSIAGRLRPFADAGFRIESVCSPSEALAYLASTRRRPETDTAVAWLSLNTHGAAIGIVRDTELLYARAFSWSYVPTGSGSTAQLLQRYSLVAHLAPEVQRGIAAVRATNGCPVETAVTCGNLPDLRSLTMPLIEELDIEVETLDSVDGIQVTGSARRERFAEHAPALRLAIATALGPPAANRPSTVERVFRTAAALVVGAGLIWLAFAVRGPGVGSPPVSEAAAPAPAPLSPVNQSAGSTSDTSAPPVPAVPAPLPESTAPATPHALPAPEPRGAVPAGEQRAVARPASETGVTADTGLATASGRPEPEAKAPPVVGAAAPRRGPERPPQVATPLPRLESILVDGNRRLAILDGQIVGVGGSSGSRTVVRIETDAIVLREASGQEVRLTIGSDL